MRWKQQCGKHLSELHNKLQVPDTPLKTFWLTTNDNNHKQVAHYTLSKWFLAFSAPQMFYNQTFAPGTSQIPCEDEDEDVDGDGDGDGDGEGDGVSQFDDE
ncbi:hypothetical protein Tco_1188957 [Tanacetum coccineum]